MLKYGSSKIPRKFRNRRAMTYLLLGKVLYSANEFLTNTNGLLVDSLQGSKDSLLVRKSCQHSKTLKCDWIVLSIVQ